MNAATSVVLGIVSLACFALRAVPSRSESVGLAGGGQGNSGKADPHSYGNPEQVRIQQFELDLTVDFENRRLNGYVILDIQQAAGCAG